MIKRAYSQITIKSIDEDKRIIEGVATSPTADRYGDVVEPSGAEYVLPMPFLMQHDSREPIGHVIDAKVSKSGITIKAKLVKIAEPGALKDRLDEAWQCIKSGLVRGLSIGFTPIESARIKDTYSEHYLKWS
jgi:phage head maturation protease